MKIFENLYILASASPRRKEILESAGFKIKVIPANIDESEQLKNVDLIAQDLAEKKANEIFKTEKNNIIIAADTTVIFNKTLLEKPKDKAEAKHFLNLMSNKKHKVVTGVCVLNQNKKIAFNDVTEVQLYKLSETEIDYYINNFEVLDKAGAYGIQSWFGLTSVKKINGCFYNVMGLPMPKLFDVLKTF